MSEQSKKKCQGCGAECIKNEAGYWKYECQSFENYCHGHLGPVHFASHICLNRQLAQSQAENAQLREALGNLAFAVRRLFEHEREFINDEKYCRFCEMDYDEYVSDTFPHLNTCAFRDVEKAIKALEADK